MARLTGVLALLLWMGCTGPTLTRYQIPDDSQQVLALESSSEEELSELQFASQGECLARILLRQRETIVAETECESFPAIGTEILVFHNATPPDLSGTSVDVWVGAGRGPVTDILSSGTISIVLFEEERRVGNRSFDPFEVGEAIKIEWGVDYPDPE